MRDALIKMFTTIGFVVGVVFLPMGLASLILKMHIDDNEMRYETSLNFVNYFDKRIWVGPDVSTVSYSDGWVLIKPIKKSFLYKNLVSATPKKDK